MSLKAFHVVFIVASLLFSAGLAGWGLRQYATRGDRTGLALGVAGVVGGAVLMVYGRWFLRKLRNVSYV